MTGLSPIQDGDSHGEHDGVAYIGVIVDDQLPPIAHPTAPTRPHVWERPGGPIEDPYAWMRDIDDPEFLGYLQDENAYSDQYFAAHKATVETIFGEIKSRIQETDMSTPVRDGSWWYVSRTQEGLSYPIHHRGPTSDNADRHVLLDENIEAAGHEYFDLGAFDASHDHRSFAWSMDTSGDERYTMRIRTFDTDISDTDISDTDISDTDTASNTDSGGRDLDDVIDDVSNAGTAWSQDGTTLFYVRPDDQERPSQVWRHRVGDVTGSDDILVYDEPDERFFVAIGETRSAEWIVIHVASKTSSEVLLAPSDLTAPFTIVRPRRDDVEYQVDHWGDRFVMTTNDAAVDFRVLTAPVETASVEPAPVEPASTQPAGIDPVWTTAEAWSELIAHLPGRRITGTEAFSTHLIVHEWADAQPRLRILFRDDAFPERCIDLGDEPHDIDLSANPEWETDTVRFSTHSMVTPPTLYSEHIATGERILLRQAPTPNVDLTKYVTRRLWAPSPGAAGDSADGAGEGGASENSVLVPLDIVHHVDTVLDGSAPAVLYGYGSYEASLAPWFSVARLSLLDRGMVFALAHPRGGGELGRKWYLDGKLLTKQHTFDDMHACSEHLVDQRVCAPDRLAIRGGSAGGLLVGACMTQRPDLYASVVAEVPFVDIVSTMSDPSLPLTVTEWEEWGDPRSEPFASAMAAYSPYDNTVAAPYPAVYISAGLNDPRVSVHEPAKWMARLRAVDTGDETMVMRTEMGAGHGGPTGRYDAWRDEARTLAFLLDTT